MKATYVLTVGLDIQQATPHPRHASEIRIPHVQFRDFPRYSFNLSFVSSCFVLLVKMSSGRALGRGRILGNARNLSPVASPSPQHQRNTSVLSPSDSSLSLNSQVSNSIAPTVTEVQDLASKVSIGQSDHAAAVAAASSKLVCPICNEEMVRFP
jgi:hypothetical protein